MIVNHLALLRCTVEERDKCEPVLKAIDALFINAHRPLLYIAGQVLLGA